MKLMKVISVLVLAIAIAACRHSLAVMPDDFTILTGPEWRGNLTYLDYGTKKKVSIPSNLTVLQSPSDPDSYTFEYFYPDEPKANDQEVIEVSRDGLMIDGETVVERSTAGGVLRIVTEKTGEDDDRKALFRFTYLISPASFSLKKEVRFDGERNFLERNEYRWSR